ncbi:tRNA modification GTPase MnmE [Planctomycetales bacterium]|nr:tRNA modification GTPase MnmE [Planctomycetales bacterium]GHS98750.1 tRNA modification GTPase MnmE [Planctomycetales bacterium]GHT07853.1 tRNA modification GTPase MnmE [Planctomycetales bacterium]
MLYSLSDTIVAISSPPHHSPLGIVRLSGALARVIAGKIFMADNVEIPDRRGAWRGAVRYVAADQNCALPAVLYQMPAPHSYTGDDVVELVAPGAPAVGQKIVEWCCEHGARLAAGGEFTYRAVMNGRLSLAEARAVAELIGANDGAGRREALDILRSGVAAPIGRRRDELRAVAAMVEAELDFSEDETPPEFFPALRSRLLATQRALAAAWQNAQRWRRRDAYFSVGLTGATNAGKSSLFNRLLNAPAAIVAPEKSTTRDQLTRVLTAGNFQFSLTDCPGADSSDNRWAQTLRDRNAARQHFSLRLFVIDATERLSETLAAELNDAVVNDAVVNGATIIALNKIDLLTAAARRERIANYERRITNGEVVAVSAVTGEGVEALWEKICAVAAQDRSPTGDRHEREIAALQNADAALTRALNVLPDLELAAFELRAAEEEFLALTGERYDENLFAAVFSQMCVGK